VTARSCCPWAEHDAHVPNTMHCVADDFAATFSLLFVRIADDELTTCYTMEDTLL